MKPTAPDHPSKRDPKYYRFGLSGLTSGGKTCLLAALALPRVAHPKGLTADLLPLPHKPAQHLSDGCNWVAQACDALKDGKVPPPNPHTEGLTLRYKFTDGENREFFVELEDYSGELLDSSLSQEELAARLRRYLAEVDGFLFIAEHPKPGEAPAELAGYLQNLTKALALLRDETRTGEDTAAAPIALLVNKWDRSGPIARGGPAAHEEENLKLQAFFATEPLPPHSGLLDSLRAAAKGACRAFPVSAFGEAVRDPNVTGAGFRERPAQVEPELPSFGILEPFLWLVEECDRRTAGLIESEGRNRLLWLDPKGTLRCHLRARTAIVRMSSSTPAYERLRAVCGRMKGRYFFHALLLLAIFSVAEFAWDYVALQQARTGMSNPADPGGWDGSEKWFAGYVEGGPLRHILHRILILDKGEASQELLTARNSRDEKAWESVSRSDDGTARTRLAEKYIHDFPQGKHRKEADRILAVHEVTLARNQLNQALDKLEARMTALETKAGLEMRNGQPNLKPIQAELKILSDETDRLPNRDTADEATEKRISALVSAIGRIANDIVTKSVQEEHRRAYYELVKRDDWVGAGKYLAGLPDDFQDLASHFASNGPQQIERIATVKVGNGAEWQEGLNYLNEYRDIKVSRLMPDDWDARLSKLEMRIKVKGDKYLYSRCTGSGSGPYREYLEGAPLGTMKNVATRWIDYFELRENPNTFRVGIDKIVWGQDVHKADAWGNTENELKISVGGTVKDSKLWDGRKGIYVPNDREKFAPVLRNVLADTVQDVSVRLWDVDIPDPGDFLGGTDFQSTMDGLQDRMEVLKAGEHGASKVVFWVEVIDKSGAWTDFRKPEQPSWSPPD